MAARAAASALLRPWRRALNNTMRTAEERSPVPERSQDPERIGRMEFMLTLRRRGIIDQAVLRAMDEVPREHFVAPDCLDSAYGDHALPIACGQSISQP